MLGDRMRMSAGGGVIIPPDELASIAHWWRADMGVTGDADVTLWEDQVGSWDLLSPWSSPDYEATGGPNSTPCINMGGVSAFEYISGTSISPPYTMLIIYKHVADVGNSVAFNGSGSTSGSSCLYNQGGANEFRFYPAGGGTVCTSVTAAVDWQLFHCHSAVAANASYIRLNNNTTPSASGAAGGILQLARISQTSGCIGAENLG